MAPVDPHKKPWPPTARDAGKHALFGYQRLAQTLHPRGWIGSGEACIAAQDLPLAIWEIQEAELINALRLKAFGKEITPAQADRQIEFFQDRWKRGFYHFPEIRRTDLMHTLRRLGSETPRLGCRTMDILHVTCALEISASGFVTIDKRQAELAYHAGLNVV